MPGNFLYFDYFSSLTAIFITFIFLFVAPSITLLCIFSALDDEDYEEMQNKARKINWKRFVLVYTIIGLILVLFSPFYLYSATTENNFNSVYDVKLIEKSPISEIKYSKRDEFKGGNIINSLYKESGTLYIIKDPRSDQYFVSDNQETVLKAAQGTINSHLYKITFSKEDIKKTIENKIEEFPVVKESEFK